MDRRFTLMLLAWCLTLPLQSFAQSARFSGGVCDSQGSWVQSALQQADVIYSALETLRADPNCKVLVDAVGSLGKTNPGSLRDPKDPNAEFDAVPMAQSSYANFFRELGAVGGFLRPQSTPMLGGAGLPSSFVQRAIFNVAFNKSFEALKDLGSNPDYVSFTPAGSQQGINQVALNLKFFLDKAKIISNASMKTASTVLAALPQSRMCLHNRPNEAMTILSAAIQTGASVISGGQVNGIGSFLSNLINYSREMSFVSTQFPLEYERFRASISCLVESTNESYCALQDAEDALNFMKGNTESSKALSEKAIANQERDPLQNSMAGMILLMRDLPILQGWMQLVLFGVDPRLDLEAQMKNSYWSSQIKFIQSINTLLAGFRDRQAQFKEGSAKRDLGSSQNQVRQTLDFLTGAIREGGGAGIPMPGDTNFYEKVTTISILPFTLLGITPPADFSQVKTFDVFWQEWARTGQNGLNNPEKLLEKMKSELWKIIDNAKYEANTFFGSRMIVDPQVLLSQAFRGPGVTPYQAFINQKTYLINLQKKLEHSLSSPRHNRNKQIISDVEIKAQLPLINDTLLRLNSIIASLEAYSKLEFKDNSVEVNPSREDWLEATRKNLDIIYDYANMQTSRNTFFATRFQNLVQMDIADTLATESDLSPRQMELLKTLGGDIINRLSTYFSPDPVSARADISQAKLIHLKNLRATEQQFAIVLFNHILQLTCALDGGVACKFTHLQINPIDHYAFDPVVYNNPVADALNNWFRENPFLHKMKVAYYYQKQNEEAEKSMKSDWWEWAKNYPIWHFTKLPFPQAPTEDSAAVRNIKAKLCIQSLAFESRESFVELCRGAVLESEFSDSTDSKKLNSNYDELYQTIAQLKTTKTVGNIEKARSIGVCALRTYLRKNHIYRMYTQFQEQ